MNKLKRIHFLPFLFILFLVTGCNDIVVSLAKLASNNDNTGTGSTYSGANQISVSAGTSCALFSTGKVKCWGSNSDGQLGTGTTTDSLVPVEISGFSSQVTQISAASHHTCIVTDQGAVQCWGKNSSGQLGTGNTTASLIPVTAVGLSSKAVKVYTNDEVWGNFGWTCAILDTGSIQCWGEMPDGLGDGVNTQSNSPVTVTGSAGAKKLSIGSDHACFVTSTDGVKCWGGQAQGKLGDGQTTASQSPVDVFGLSSGVVDIGANSSGWDNDGFSCAVLSTGAVKCWGMNFYGELGNGLTTSSNVPVNVANIANASSVYVAVTSGNTRGHTCTLGTDSLLTCWGANTSGIIGDGTTIDIAVPLAINVFSGAISSFSNLGDGANGAGHSCAMKADDTINCWGLNGYGQLGDGTTTNRATP